MCPLGSRRRGRTRTARSLALLVCLASVGRPLTAQEREETASRDERHRARAAASMPGLEPTPRPCVWPGLVEVQCRSLATDALVGVAQTPQHGSSRDSVTNGAIIGAIVGAVGLAALGASICHLYQEDAAESCLPDTLRGAAIGAAIGAGAGVSVDAVLTRHAGVTVRIGVRF